MKKSIIYYIVLFILVSFSDSISLANPHSDIIEKKIDSLKSIGVNEFIIYGEYFTYSKNIVQKTVITYQQDNKHYLIEIRSINGLYKVTSEEVMSVISDIYKKNYREINSVLSTKNILIDTISHNADGTYTIKKQGADHGINYFFKIINENENLQMEICCVTPNSFFYEKKYPLWLLMSAFRNEMK